VITQTPKQTRCRRHTLAKKKQKTKHKNIKTIDICKGRDVMLTFHSALPISKNTGSCSLRESVKSNSLLSIQGCSSLGGIRIRSPLFHRVNQNANQTRLVKPVSRNECWQKQRTKRARRSNARSTRHSEGTTKFSLCFSHHVTPHKSVPTVPPSERHARIHACVRGASNSRTQ
jgi:hypothetical protein